MDFHLAVLILLLTLALFSFISHKKKLLNFEGILLANIIGIAIFLFSNGSLLHFFVAVIFFVVAEAGTFYANDGKPRHEIRTAGNILGNSAIAVLCLLVGFPLGFFAAFASVLADKLSSEIGLLSKRKPLLITTFKPVLAGTDGGVTLLGIWASIAGAAIIAAVHLATEQNLLLFLVLVISGIFGSLVDSFFGAAFERKKLLNNNEVNFLGSLGGTALAWLIASALGYV